MPPESVAPLPSAMLTAAQVARAFGIVGRNGRPTVTWRRWVKQGILPAPQLIGGRNLFPASAVAFAQAKLGARSARTFPPAPGGADGMQLGHTLRDEAAELRSAAGRALATAGLDAIGPVIRRYAPSGRLREVPAGRRKRLTEELRRLSAAAPLRGAA